jgi:hypothetical protein
MGIVIIIISELVMEGNLAPITSSISTPPSIKRRRQLIRLYHGSRNQKADFLILF